MCAYRRSIRKYMCRKIDFKVPSSATTRIERLFSQFLPLFGWVYLSFICWVFFLQVVKLVRINNLLKRNVQFLIRHHWGVGGDIYKAVCWSGSCVQYVLLSFFNITKLIFSFYVTPFHEFIDSSLFMRCRNLILVALITSVSSSSGYREEGQCPYLKVKKFETNCIFQRIFGRESKKKSSIWKVF